MWVYNLLFYIYLQVKVPMTDKPSETVGFRKLLLNRCQREFEKDKDEEIDLEKLQKLIDEADGVSICNFMWTWKNNFSIEQRDKSWF